MRKLIANLLFICTVSAHASSFPLPATDESLIGQIEYGTVQLKDTAASIAKRYDIGFNALQQANPHIQFAKQFAVGTRLQIPNLHLLPSPRQGIVVNLPEMRMYFYATEVGVVYSYPIGIGKIGKTIPITHTRITRKAHHPTWYPPKDIRAFNLEQGIILPKVVPPGPDNPLGPYAIYMKLPTYLMHSTIFPESVGTRASFGCLRMYESDVENLFDLVKPGIPVAIINMPGKLGWQKDRLYVEVHPPLEEYQTDGKASLTNVIKKVSDEIIHRPTLVDWQMLTYTVSAKDGIPHEIGKAL